VSEFQNDFESPAAHHHYIDAGEELLEPVRHLLASQQEIERVVPTSQKAVDAYSAED
jgi:hypothetical protein